MPKPVIDIVKGMSLAFNRRRGFYGVCVLKVDLGKAAKSFWLMSAQINWFIEYAPYITSIAVAGTDVTMQASDWDAEIVPTVTELQFVDASDGVVTLLTLNRGEPSGLFFSQGLWSRLIGLLVQYRANAQTYGESLPRDSELPLREFEVRAGKSIA